MIQLRTSQKPLGYNIQRKSLNLNFGFYCKYRQHVSVINLIG